MCVSVYPDMYVIGWFEYRNTFYVSLLASLYNSFLIIKHADKG